MVMAPPRTRDSAILPCFHGSLASLHRHFPPQSPPSHPLDPSLHSQQQRSSWDCSTIPKRQLPATAPSTGPVSLPRVCMAVARTLCISLHLGHHRSAVSLSALNDFSSDLDNCPDVGIGPLLQFPAPSPTEGGSSPTNTPVFPPSSFILPSFPWFYTFFSASQVLLSTLSCCSACSSVSKGVFLMHPWREMYSTSTYSSTILFSVITFEGSGTLIQYSCLENPMDGGAW